MGDWRFARSGIVGVEVAGGDRGAPGGDTRQEPRPADSGPEAGRQADANGGRPAGPSRRGHGRQAGRVRAEAGYSVQGRRGAGGRLRFRPRHYGIDRSRRVHIRQVGGAWHREYRRLSGLVRPPRLWGVGVAKAAASVSGRVGHRRPNGADGAVPCRQQQHGHLDADLPRFRARR